MFKSIKNKIKNSGVLGNKTYGKTWQERDGKDQVDWYTIMHDSHEIQHQDFIKYFKSKNIETVLEVGCGTGFYPINLKELFTNVKYTGTDISKTAIKYCKANSEHEFIAGDFITFDFSKQFDLVYSHAVIDHVYDMDAFASKIVELTKKFAYITAYRGFFPKLKQHKINWNHEEGSYYNDFSIIQIKKVFKEMGLQDDEISVRSLKIDNTGLETDYQTIIEIQKHEY